MKAPKKETREKRKDSEIAGRTNKTPSTQVGPSIDSTFVGCKLEILFEYPNTLEGKTCFDWPHGIVENIVNKNRHGACQVLAHRLCWHSRWDSDSTAYSDISMYRRGAFYSALEICNSSYLATAYWRFRTLCIWSLTKLLRIRLKSPFSYIYRTFIYVHAIRHRLNLNFS